MARVIQEHIKRPLAEELLFGKLLGGGQVRVSVTSDESALILEVPSGLAARSRRRSRVSRSSAAAVDDTTLGQVVRGHLYRDLIAR